MKKFLALCVVSLLLITSCIPVRKVIAIYGDSITAISTVEISTALKGEYIAYIKATSGKRTDEMLPLVDGKGSEIVINLGTNDASQGIDPLIIEANLQLFIDRNPQANCFVFVTFQSNTFNVPFNQGAQAVDSWLFSLKDSNSMVRIADWDILDAPTYDTIHPTPEGRVIYANLLHDTLATC